MNQLSDATRRNAAAAAALLLLTGALLGVVADRLWLVPRPVEAMPLTVEAMSARLDLGPADEARIRALLDSMHAEVTAAVQHGPDSLATTGRSAHLRLEAALPVEARPAFRAWMQDHHRQIMERLGETGMHGAGTLAPGATGGAH